MNILCIDDEPEILRILIQYLEMIGHTAQSAIDGKEGWKVFNSYQPGFDLIITDVRMPGMTGLQFLEKLRKLGLDTPVVVISGHNDHEIAEADRQFGILKILAKPFSFDDVDDAVAIVST